MQRFTLPATGGHVAGLNFGRATGPIDLVFLHATGFNALTYRPLLSRFGPDHRVVALDLRGHGHTTLPAHAWKLTDWYTYAKDVVGALRQLGDGTPRARLIAGHSMGGTVSLLALQAEPALAGALLLLDPAFITPQMRRFMLLPFGPALMRRRVPIARNAARRRHEFPTSEAVLASYRGRGAFKTWQPGFLEDYIEDGFQRRADGTVALSCAPAWEAATFSAHRHDLQAALRAVRVPSMLLLAEHGSIASRALPQVNEAVPAMQVETLAGTSHFLPMEKPDEILARMRRLMGEPGTPGASSGPGALPA